jgi:hypothetical protein
MLLLDLGSFGSLAFLATRVADILQFPDYEANEDEGEEDGLKELFFVILIIAVAEVRQNLDVVLGQILRRQTVLYILSDVDALYRAQNTREVDRQFRKDVSGLLRRVSESCFCQGVGEVVEAVGKSRNSFSIVDSLAASNGNFIFALVDVSLKTPKYRPLSYYKLLRQKSIDGHEVALSLLLHVELVGDWGLHRRHDGLADTLHARSLSFPADDLWIQEGRDLGNNN